MVQKLKDLTKKSRHSQTVPSTKISRYEIKPRSSSSIKDTVSESQNVINIQSDVLTHNGTEA